MKHLYYILLSVASLLFITFSCIDDPDMDTSLQNGKAPAVSETSQVSITASSLILKASLLKQNGSEIIEYGFCWSDQKDANPKDNIRNNRKVKATNMIYYSPFFILLQILLVVNFIVASIKHHYLKRGRWGLITVHFAFIVILTGALVSFLTGENGMMHIRNQEISNKMVIDDKGGMDVYKSLPFSIELVKFKLTRYPGSTSPSSYESFVRVHAGLRVFGMSVITNEGYHFADDFVNSGADVIAVADKAASVMNVLFTELISKI